VIYDEKSSSEVKEFSAATNSICFTGEYLRFEKVRKVAMENKHKYIIGKKNLVII